MAIIVNGKKVAGVGLPGKDGAPGADVHLESPPIRRQKRKDIPEPKRSLTPLWLVCKVLHSCRWLAARWQGRLL